MIRVRTYNDGEVSVKDYRDVESVVKSDDFGWFWEFMEVSGDDSEHAKEEFESCETLRELEWTFRNLMDYDYIAFKAEESNGRIEEGCVLEGTEMLEWVDDVAGIFKYDSQKEITENGYKVPIIIDFFNGLSCRGEEVLDGDEVVWIAHGEVYNPLA